MSSQSTFCAPLSATSATVLPDVVTASRRALSPESLCVHSTPRREPEATRPDSSVANPAVTWPVTRTRSGRLQSAGVRAAAAATAVVAVAAGRTVAVPGSRAAAPQAASATRPASQPADAASRAIRSPVA